jgi:hypothetical protein
VSSRLRPARWAALATVCVALLGACGDEEDAGSAGPAPPAKTPAPGPAGKDRAESERGEEGASGKEPAKAGSAAHDDQPKSKPGGGSDAGGRSPGSYDADKPDSEDNDVPPPAGSPAERFERFCEKNPRGCY